MVLAPRPAIGPEAQALAGARTLGLEGSLVRVPSLEPAVPTERVATAPRVVWRAPQRPARFIDDEVRQRALEAVTRGANATSG